MTRCFVKLKQSHTLSEAWAGAESKPMLDRASDNGATRTLQLHIDRQPPSLRSLRPDLSAEFVRIVKRMMAKDQAERFQTPADVAKALSTFATGSLASMQR